MYRNKKVMDCPKSLKMPFLLPASISWEIHWLLSCVDFMDVIMGEYTGYFHVLISWMLWEIYQLLSCVDFMDVIMGDTCISMSKEEGPWLNLTLHCLTLCVYPLTKGRTKSL